jgi:hypothetical protein
MSWHAWLVLLRPGRVIALLERIQQSGRRAPNLWQVEVGILRMWHRIVFRGDTIGTCKTHPIRDNWRARMLHLRAFRFPFLVWERAITPWDLSGFLSGRSQFIRHLLCAHHDGTQCVYDLQILSLQPGALMQLREPLARIVAVDNARSRWVRDLCVYERYHDELLVSVDRMLAGAQELDPADATDPDISFWAYLDWCRFQPATPRAWWKAWRAGRFDWVRGVDGEPA